MARAWTRNRTPEDFRTHLLEHRLVDGECWVWTRSVRNPGGYGQIWHPERNAALPVHRLAAHLWLGFDLDSPLYVCHTCDNPPCFNPDHLFIGTNSENILDARAKGRLNRARGEARPNAKLTEVQVREIRSRHADGGISFAELGALYGVTHQATRSICQRKTWAHVA